MLYTMQIFYNSGNHANPKSTDVTHCRSLKEAIGIFAPCYKDRMGEYPEAEAILRRGHIADVTDIYPDMRLFFGPRFGVRKEVV